MIKSKKELSFYIMADMMMNRGKFKYTIKDRIRNVFLPDYIMQYMKSMRYVSYISENKHLVNPYFKIIGYFHALRFRKLGIKLGFSIGAKVFGYGLVIPHYGSIVVGKGNKIGNYAVMHTNTCITTHTKIIGNGLNMGTGAVLTSKIQIGNNCSINANTVVNKSFGSNLIIAGYPAYKIKDAEAWYLHDGEPYSTRVRMVEDLKCKIHLDC